jgi:hypothetical protein
MEWQIVEKKKRKPKDTQLEETKIKRDPACTVHGEGPMKSCAGCALRCCLICYGNFRNGNDLCIYCRGEVICKDKSKENRAAEAWARNYYVQYKS